MTACACVSYCTVRVTLVVRWVGPELPIIVMVYVPAAVPGVGVGVGIGVDEVEPPPPPAQAN